MSRVNDTAPVGGRLSISTLIESLWDAMPPSLQSFRIPAIRIHPTWTVLSHTYGNPASYPSKSVMETLRGEYGGYKSASALPVVQGNDDTASGVQNLEISVESGFEVTTAVGVEVEASIGGGAGGASVLANAGFSVGYTGTISTSKGTTFGGTVGYLPTTYYNNPAYNDNSGLFVYRFADERDGRQYWIVDYWVE
jgi:hypothetical protein